MTAIDISTKICKTNFGARLSQQLFDGKPLATNAWECPMLEVAAGGWGVILDPQPQAFYSGFRDG